MLPVAGRHTPASDQEAGHLAEAGARPTVEAAFERHAAAEMHDDGRERKIEEQHGGDPEDEVRAAELGGDSDPGGADHAEHLSEDEVEEAELLAEGGFVDHGFFNDGIEGRSDSDAKTRRRGGRRGEGDDMLAG